MPEQVQVVVNGLELSLRVWSCAHPSDPPIVLLPATGETAEDWDTIAQALCDTRCVYAVNLRGHGRSAWPGTYSLQLFTDDVIGLLDHLDEDGVDLVGHSLGGLVACKVAAARPDRIRRLILEDVPMPHPRPAATPARPDGDLAFDWRVVEQVRPEIDTPDPQWPLVVTRIRAPTLIIAGGTASPMTQAHVAELADRLPAGHLANIEAGHFVHATRPEEFLQRLRNFLNS